jgi:hypothetical protein
LHLEGTPRNINLHRHGISIRQPDISLGTNDASEELFLGDFVCEICFSSLTFFEFVVRTQVTLTNVEYLNLNRYQQAFLSHSIGYRLNDPIDIMN